MTLNNGMSERVLFNFEGNFCALTGYRPMRWQRNLFARFVQNDLPEVCDIPTGLGKTSVLPIWLLAVAQQAEAGALRLPRRLVYIVNRRTVVDQATEVVERMRARLVEPDHADWREHRQRLRGLAHVLQQLGTAGPPPVAVSTLRGELADNEEWKADPARPAIVVGTIDMIGSKLLFSGYGDGRYGRAHHAGLIGQDALIVHDEAHLTPVFGELLSGVAEEQRQHSRDGAIVRPIRVLELSATSRRTSGVRVTLEEEDSKDRIVRDRLNASKRLRLHPAKQKELTREIVERTLAYKDGRERVLIYVRSPEQASKLAVELAKKLGAGGAERVAVLTGTIRGYERDQLLRQPPKNSAARVIRHFLDGTTPCQTVFLVSTSAGEVGIDLDGDHMVCDLTTLDSLIQRLGRVNRRGGTDREAHVDVVVEPPKEGNGSELGRAIAATRRILERWGGEQTDGIDVSPGNVRELLARLDAAERESAFSPAPQAPQLTDILLDGWSLTSVDKMPGVPEVAAFLHGLTKDPPQTHVAWRREVTPLAKAQVTDAGLRAWFLACRVESRERLRGRTVRVRAALEKLLKKRRKKESNQDLDFPVVLLDERGRAEWCNLSEIVQKENEARLEYRTLVLPVEAGGVNEKGMLDPDFHSPAVDVAETGPDPDERQRWLCRTSADSARFERLDSGEIQNGPPRGLREKVRVELTRSGESEENGESVDLVLFVSPRRSALEDPETASARQTLEEHGRAIADRISAIAKQLNLPNAIREALVTAARWHDKGKDRRVWQRYARNDLGGEPVAKTERYLHPQALGGYRHEFGSLLDAKRDPSIQNHPERDLVLHLIAAHHGWARPHFPPRSFDSTRTTADNEEAAVEVMRRYERLQRRFGRWGLAWLESLLRCADVATSRAVAEGAVAGPQRGEAQK
ncbi:type I-G CRISPR-associated helicase/endonuclease Cas3g [Deferrisoma sp.]